MEIEKEVDDCEVLDGYQLEKVEPKDLSEFMFNPFKRSAYCNGMVFQKYLSDTFIDEVLCMKDSIIAKVAYIHYPIKKVYTQFEFNNLEIECLDNSFVTIRSLIEKVIDITKNAINEAKVANMSEIKKQVIYNTLYSMNYDGLFNSIVFSRILGEDYEFISNSVTEQSALTFARQRGFLELIDITNGKLYDVKAFVDELIFTKDFINREVVCEGIKEEAYAYFEAGCFNQRELQFKKLVEKIKGCGILILDAKLSDGCTVHLLNHISCLGKFRQTNDGKHLIDFHLIETIEHNGKIIYDKNDV